MLNKRIIIAASVFAGAAIAAAALFAHGINRSVEAVYIDGIADKGRELIDVITDEADMSGYLEHKDSFVPLEVKMAFIDGGGCARAIVHNNTDTPITAYDMELVYFDKDGAALDKTKACTVDNVLIGAREDFGTDKYIGGSEGGSYIKAVIKGVRYNDGTAWQNENAEVDLALGSSDFDIERFEKSIAKNKDNVLKAAENPYLFTNEMTATNVDGISGRRDLKLVLTNTSQKTVSGIKVAVAEFDKDNKPVDVTPQIYIGKNIRLAVCRDMELGSGESRSFASSAFLESECYRINAVVTEITFSDGTVWKNPYTVDWLLWFM